MRFDPKRGVFDAEAKKALNPAGLNDAGIALLRDAGARLHRGKGKDRMPKAERVAVQSDPVVAVRVKTCKIHRSPKSRRTILGTSPITDDLGRGALIDLLQPLDVQCPPTSSG
jgi:hypothetical protein